ncbi:DUF1829 domain-containing protein [Priestia megaterium]|uniref:DUF1829 domain-containing protein n=1 Tax=Priestia megaterium TaxID=1404 RepID=UPI00203BBAFE|nr:DUF1829 domain-containing protein [Priestia megaterium]MCM3196280.1 DUF1829 domain-containing protein [Priestia megaterium]
MVAKENLKKSYVDWLNTKITYKDLEAGTIEITTPFLDRHNDRLQIYAIPQQDDTIKLTDDGYILSDLFLSGFELRGSKKRQQMFNTIINGYGVSFDKEYDELFVVASFQDFPQKKHMLIQAMMTVNDMFMTVKATVSSLFAEDVGNFLHQNNIRYNENVFLAGKSGYTHNFNYLIPPFKDAPERVVHTMNSPNKSTLSNILFSWGDTREIRNQQNYKSELYVFINDQDKNVDSSLENAFKIEGIHPVLWSKRKKVVGVLSA